MSWFNVLESVRRIARRRNRSEPTQAIFTAEELASEARIKATKKAPASWVASAWLGKFVRWGYVIREARVLNKDGGSVRAYRITEWGLKKYKPTRKQHKRK